MTAPDAATLERECAVFGRYLVGHRPDATVRAHYVEAVAQLEGVAVRTRFDRMLLALASLHPLFTRMVDLYARLFARATSVHRRLVLLLAILEARAATAAAFEQPAHTGLAGFLVDMTWRALIALVLLIVSAPLLLPAQWLWHRGTG